MEARLDQAAALSAYDAAWAAPGAAGRRAAREGEGQWLDAALSEHEAAGRNQVSITGNTAARRAGGRERAGAASLAGASGARGPGKGAGPGAADDAQLAEESLRRAEALVLVCPGDVARLQRAREARAASALEALPRQAAALSRALWGSGHP